MSCRLGESRRKLEPCSIVILGASGDLTSRKLIPALYNLLSDGLLSKDFAIVGFARKEMSTEQFRAELNADMPKFATGKLDPSGEGEIGIVEGGLVGPAAAAVFE